MLIGDSISRVFTLMETMLSRMIRAIKLDPSLFQEVEEDSDASNQAMLIVIISSICAGLGSMLKSMIFGGISIGFRIRITSNLMNGLVGVSSALLGWMIWSLITYFVGTKILAGPETEADYGELLRTIGFSSSPGIFRVLSFLPLISLIVGIWELASMIIAVKEALELDSIRAILTCIVGWIGYIILLMIIGGLSYLGLPLR